MQILKKYLRPFYVPVATWYYVNFSGPQRYKNLFRAIRENKAKRIMEVGTWSGDRAVQMIKESQKFNSIDTVEYYGFDLFEQMSESIYKNEISKRPPTHAEVSALLTKTGAKIQLIQGDTMKTMPEVCQSLPKMDFIYIDGGHSYETIANDWKYSELLMHKNTIVIFDDYWLNREDGGCKKLIDSLDRAKYRVELSEELDAFDNKDFGRLEIRYAIVRLN